MKPTFEVTVQKDEFTQAASTAFDYTFEGRSVFQGWEKPNVPKDFSIGLILKERDILAERRTLDSERIETAHFCGRRQVSIRNCVKLARCLKPNPQLKLLLIRSELVLVTNMLGSHD